MWLDRLAGRIYRTPVADPTVAASDYPVVRPDPVARLMRLRLERVEGELPAGVVEQ